MDYSRKISERLWNQPDKGERESKREQTFIDDIVQKSHIERELLAGIGGIQTVFDAGAGSGRFSILLAKSGLHVTHFDISQPMIDKAKELAEKQGVLSNIKFMKGALEDLSGFIDKSYDLVISFDSPISYTYPNQESVIENLVRLARKKIMISVSSRLGSLPLRINPLQKNKFILDSNCDDPWVKWLISNKENAIENFHFDKRICMEILQNGMDGNGEAEIHAYENGQAPWPITYSFMPDELQSILVRFGVRNIKLAGPGAFARTFPNELLIKIMNDEMQRADFLDFCYLYDSNQFVCGMGKDNLLACGDIQETDKERQSQIYPIILSEYNPVWAAWFAEEKDNLERLIGEENIARISHFGSTSVPGLTAKPTVDILLEIKDDANISRLISALSSPEYICLNPPNMPTPPPHLVFLKGYLPDGFAEKIFHIHVRYLGDPDELHFRDYLIAHPEVAAEYAALKRRLFQDYEHDRDGYTAAKTEFIRSINRKAKEEL